MKFAFLMLLLPRVASEDFLARGVAKEAPKSEGSKKPAVLSSAGDAASIGDGADDSTKDGSRRVVSVPLDSELQEAAGKVTPALVEQSEEQEEVLEEKAEEKVLEDKAE